MFILDNAVIIKTELTTKPVMNAIDIIKRDIEKVCRLKKHDNLIDLRLKKDIAAERYEITVLDNEIIINASEELGFIYALLYISENYLNILPFWFWMDQSIEKKNCVNIPNTMITSQDYKVRFRGWFFNDEVLMLKWKMNENSDEGWRICFETLLRCGGNMVIPGTDKMSAINRDLASEYGLWITHHHAEPLGAEMFIRKYPDLEPDYFKHEDLFKKLWEEAVISQKDKKTVWNLCFRGQGDCPFWSYDKEGKYDTDEKKGRVISDLIKIQADIVKKYVDNPVFCTNLYGEIMELYEGGFVTFPENVILVRADNGYGKMVTRRRGNHNPRVSSMPEKAENSKQGIYYHVSFYDLQAANHITGFPNSVEFLNKELNDVMENRGDEFWVINCSNVRPHTFYLDAVAKKWRGEEITTKSHSKEFADKYFPLFKEEMAEAFCNYSSITIPFGTNEDEHAGEQFYTENIRHFAHYILLGKTDSVNEISWLTGNIPLREQLNIFSELCKSRLKEQEAFLESLNTFKDTTLWLQANMHYYGAKGFVLFCEAYEKLQQGQYEKAFVLFGDSAHCFEYVNQKMREQENGKWENFYFNDCQADYKFSAYIIKKVMGLVRELGDNPEHFKWQHEYCYTKEDRGVHLILLTDNHCTDEELYKAMKKAGM